MSSNGPIIIVEDDFDDQLLISKAMDELGIENRRVFFDRCSEAFQYLLSTSDKPLVIISDINLPEQSGIDFKKQIDADKQLRQKSIPFVFLSTSADRNTLNRAYLEMTVQGYFQKPTTFSELKNIFRKIVDYWGVCKHPNSAS